MPCFYPMQGWRSKTVNPKTGKRKLVYNPSKAVCDGKLPPVTHNCGQCVGCRLEYSRQWAVRCMHEASLYEDNCFITLTYSPENVPEDGSLHYKHFQDFMKRLRDRFSREVTVITGFDDDIGIKYKPEAIRFYVCGEYGEQFARPHWHACIFGLDFPDKEKWKKSNDMQLYRSPILEDLWKFGYSSIGSVTFESAAYVARYMMKKIKGKEADAHYGDRTPEFARMSLKPGIAYDWYEKHKDEIYNSDFIIVNGVKVKPPRYYDASFELAYPEEFDKIKSSRRSKLRKIQKKKPEEFTFERLRSKEKCLKARLSPLVRKLDEES